VEVFLVELRNVKKHFGKLKAVDMVSFSTNPGEILGLLGPNGAGKTTIIRMIMNILAPDEGEVLFENRKIREKDKDRIGYLPEERGLYKKVKMGDMLLYLSSLKNCGRKKANKRLDDWLERFDLTGWKDKPVENLSKGMAQKIQFIASILHDPEFIFLDEPFTGLDPVSTDTLRDNIIELGKQGKTVLFSTHNMDLAERICKRIFIINKGKELISGPLDEVKSKFGKNAVVIEFDGNIDFLTGSDLVSDIIKYPRWVEVELTGGSTADDILRICTGRLSIKRFEVVAPSLHKIFVKQLGGHEQKDLGGGNA
jgi:ABC-2 type transport system ATP-binding protein